MKPQILELSAMTTGYLYTGRQREDLRLDNNVGWGDYNRVFAWLHFYGVC
jgi:hypothetical protein